MEKERYSFFTELPCEEIAEIIAAKKWRKHFYFSFVVGGIFEKDLRAK